MTSIYWGFFREIIGAFLSNVSSVPITLPYPENTHLLCKGKHHCTADLLFDWFGFLLISI